jgi:hypothetical protein
MDDDEDDDDDNSIRLVAVTFRYKLEIINHPNPSVGAASSVRVLLRFHR